MGSFSFSMTKIEQGSESRGSGNRWMISGSSKMQSPGLTGAPRIRCSVPHPKSFPRNSSYSSHVQSGSHPLTESNKQARSVAQALKVSGVWHSEVAERGLRMCIVQCHQMYCYLSMPIGVCYDLVFGVRRNLGGQLEL